MDTEPNIEQEEASSHQAVNEGVKKSSKKFLSGLYGLFRGKGKHIDEMITELFDVLLMSDMTVETAQYLTDHVRKDKRVKKADDLETVKQVLGEHMKALLAKVQQPLILSRDKKPETVLVIGVNGSGKTTTIGKMASYYREKEGGKAVMVAADTFRAAAAAQLEIWAERTQSYFVKGDEGADPAAVAFQGCQFAMEQDCDIAWIDTAGRLQNKKNLMDELSKVVRVIEKVTGRGPDHVLLVLDAGIGKNALDQVKAFHDCVPITGLVMTKLDGTAKGGMLFSIASSFEIPIHFIGVGEKVKDLRVFESDLFVDALLCDQDA